MTSSVGYWTGSLTYAGNTVQFGQADSNGTVWLIQGLSGFDGVDIGQGQITQRSSDHGGLGSPQFYAPRMMTLTVTAMAANQYLRDVARAQLSSVVPLGTQGSTDLATFVYNEPIPKTLQVRRSGQLAELSLDLNSVTFSVGLAAPDPRKYSAQVYSSQITAPVAAAGITFPITWPITWPSNPLPNSSSAVNHGNFESPFTVQVYGPWVAPSVSSVEQNRTISYSSLTLGSGDVLTVDTNKRISYLNGIYRPADLGAQWFRLLPPGSLPQGVPGGVNTIRLGGSGTGYATLSYSDAWQ